MVRMGKWRKKWSSILNDSAAVSKVCQIYVEANQQAIEDVVRGRGPDSRESNPDSGARMVVNISSVHVPAFCSSTHDAYKNAYDLKKYRIGDKAPEKMELRENVDDALPLKHGTKADKVYFGAVELSGSGIRFYGDLCLVLNQLLSTRIRLF